MIKIPSPFENSLVQMSALPRHMDGLRTLPSVWESDHPRRSAVCLIFCGDPYSPDQPARVLLTLRSSRLNSHRGQVSFPGGRFEEGDRSPMETVVREVDEEIGIPHHKLKFHGSLDPVTAIDGSWVIPLVATTSAHLAEVTPNPSEIAELMIPPWTELTREHQKEFAFTIFGMRRRSFLFDITPYPVWGLTAAMLAQAQMSW